MQLERARVVLGAPVPESVPVALAGNEAWWRWWRARERAVGMARWGGEDEDDSRFVSATSDGSLASALQLARTVATDMAVHYFRPSPYGTGGGKGSSREMDRPRGGAGALPIRRVDGARAEYVQLVGNGRWS